MIGFRARKISILFGSVLMVILLSAGSVSAQYAGQAARPVVIQTAPLLPPTATVTPVETKTLTDVNPEVVGVLSANDGGLGAAMWRGTSRSVAEKTLDALSLPTPSPTLNNLARRLLLSAAALPDGNSSISQTMPSLRITKLLTLGDVAGAADLLKHTKPDYVNEIALRQTVEAMLVSRSPSFDVCKTIQDLIKTHSEPDWQKIMIVCQLRAKDSITAQLGLDVLHAQDVKDDLFFALAEKNIIAGGKQLPKNIGTLSPVTLALLQLTGIDVPVELYNRPLADLAPYLLTLPTKEDSARVQLAEIAASLNIIPAGDLANVYNSISPAPVNAAKPATVNDTAPYKRALAFQAVQQADGPATRLSAVAAYMKLATPALLNGSAAILLSDMLSAVPAGVDYVSYAPMMVSLDLLSGKTAAALEWLKLAGRGSENPTTVASDVRYIWPLMVLSGIVNDHDYAAGRAGWVVAMLKRAGDEASYRTRAANILLLFDAAGLGVSDDDWSAFGASAGVINGTDASPWVVARLRAAAATNKRGEAAALAIIAGGSISDGMTATTLDVIRALRAVGLNGDALAFAREAAVRVLFGTVSTP